MTETAWMDAGFQEHHARLRGLALRMLGSPAEAEDAVQEAWLRLTRADAASIDNLGGWLTTVVARVCLDMLRSRKSRREDALEPDVAEAALPDDDRRGPEAELLLADAMGPALLLVLDTLTPTERVAFVLHDLFDLPFQDIAAIVGRSEIAVRQLASRARRRVRDARQGPDTSDTSEVSDVSDVSDVSEVSGPVGRVGGVREVGRGHLQREVVSAFLAASRDGNLAGLIALLDPDVRLRADMTAVQMAAANRAAGAAAPALLAETNGAQAVAETFSGRARAVRLALVDGAAGAVFAPGGKPFVVFTFAVEGDRIVGMELIMDSARLAALDVEIL